MTAKQTSAPAATGRKRGKPGEARERMIDAAAYVFARHGYHGTGTRALAESLGITAASLYAHIQSKDAILEEVCARGIKYVLAHLTQAIASEEEMAARIRRFFLSWREELFDHCDYAAVYQHERKHLPYEARVRLESISRQFRAELDRLFSEAMEKGELDPDLDVRSASLLMIGTIRNVNQLYLEGPIRGFDEFVSASVEHLIRGISTGRR